MAEGSSMSPGAVALMTILLIVGGFLLIGWIVRTISFAVSTVFLVAVLGVGVYLFLRYKASG
jgi:hypothetical protein